MREKNYGSNSQQQKLRFFLNLVKNHSFIYFILYKLSVGFGFLENFRIQFIFYCLLDEGENEVGNDIKPASSYNNNTILIVILASVLFVVVKLVIIVCMIIKKRHTKKYKTKKKPDDKYSMENKGHRTALNMMSSRKQTVDIPIKKSYTGNA